MGFILDRLSVSQTLDDGCLAALILSDRAHPRRVCGCGLKLEVLCAPLFASLPGELRFGRTFRVTASADADHRLEATDISKLRARSDKGAMVPLGSLTTFRNVTGPEYVTRYKPDWVRRPPTRKYIAPSLGFTTTSVSANGVPATNSSSSPT